MSRYLIDEIEKEPTIIVRHSAQVRELVGSDRIERIAIDNGKGARSELEVSAIFSFIGAEPNSDWLDASIKRDEHGFILAGLDLRDSGFLPLETSCPTAFAVGDVRSGSIKRVAAAVGEGSMVVRLIHERLASNSYVAR
jgi:thioredoxin reductase (NADPH)